jgi:alpha-beta hydrolase superfamily lysophospholipase
MGEKNIERKEWLRPASSGRENILSLSWISNSDEAPKAVVIIAHGMAETAARYDTFARFLADAAYAVYMNEHAGHGVHAETLGYFAEKNGMEHLIEDMKSLQDEATAAYPGIPVFLFGHSMGSFLSRRYITKYGDTLSGCILSGTAGDNPATGLAKFLSAAQKKIKGPKSPGIFITKLAFGSYTKKIDKPVNAAAWLTRDNDICFEYAADPYMGFPFTASGYHDMFTLMGQISGAKWAKQIPLELPILLMSGDADPVGGYGKGVKQVHSRLHNVGVKDLKLKLYPEGRHEMLNELNKEEVFADVLEWLDAHVK